MSKKDYIKFARMIKGRIDEARSNQPVGDNMKYAYLGAMEDIAHDMADIFAQDNSLFDRERFLKACGL